MADVGADRGEIFVIPVLKVHQAIDKLLSQDVHQFFPAYLHLRREAASQGTTTEIEPNWATLSEDLRMEGGPTGKVHLRPFWVGARNNYQEWLGENLAGSYSPRSIRSAGYNVIEVDSKRRFALKDHHWELALEHLLNGRRMSAVALAAFMLRDFGWVSTTGPTVIDLLIGFRRRFGYSDDVEFNSLYDSTWGTSDSDPWFELLVDEEAQ